MFRAVRAARGWGQETLAEFLWVDRRDFVGHVAALTLGATSAAGLDIDRLTALLPHAEPTGTRHIGLADVKAIEQATATFQRQDFIQGSGLFQAAAAAQLQSVLPLLDTQTRPEVRPRLLVATATDTPAVSAATISCLAHIQARAHAVQGDSMGCDRALGHAVEQISTIDAVTTPPWSAHVSETGISGYQGAARYTLALAQGEPTAAGLAVSLLRQAVDVSPDYARLRALYLPDLAGAHALAGDIDTAVTVGHQAIDAVTTLHSPRAYDRLRVLNTALQPLHTSPGVAELRERLVTTTAA